MLQMLVDLGLTGISRRIADLVGRGDRKNI